MKEDRSVETQNGDCYAMCWLGGIMKVWTQIWKGSQGTAWRSAQTSSSYHDLISQMKQGGAERFHKLPKANKSRCCSFSWIALSLNLDWKPLVPHHKFKISFGSKKISSLEKSPRSQLQRVFHSILLGNNFLPSRFSWIEIWENRKIQ